MGFLNHKKKSKIIILFCSGLVFVGLIILVFISSKSTKLTSLRLGQTDINVELAKTPLAQYQGLSNRAELCANCGMLFVFPDLKIREFVMRDMSFPLDIIYFLNNKIVKINANLLPEGSNPRNSYSSGLPTDMVLEMQAGFSEKNGLKVGDQIFKN